jgi:hypothetical protein
MTDMAKAAGLSEAILWNHAPAMLEQAREAKMAVPTLQGDQRPIAPDR